MMVSLTINVDDDTLKHLENFSWVNWSELARQEIRKKIIFEKYLKSKNVSSEDIEFCDNMDWHPVDELPFKKSFIKKIKSVSKQPYQKMSIKDFNSLIG